MHLWQVFYEANKQQYGLIAEEVQEVFPELVAQDADGNPYTVKYHILPALLLNELQRQHAAIELQNAMIQDINNRLAAVENRN